MYVLFKTDDHHSKASEELIGVATTKKYLVLMAKKVAEQEGQEFTYEDEDELTRINQTQDYTSGQFIAYEVEKNEISE